MPSTNRVTGSRTGAAVGAIFMAIATVTTFTLAVAMVLNEAFGYLTLPELEVSYGKVINSTALARDDNDTHGRSPRNIPMDSERDINKSNLDLLSGKMEVATELFLRGAFDDDKDVKTLPGVVTNTNLNMYGRPINQNGTENETSAWNKRNVHTDTMLNTTQLNLDLNQKIFESRPKAKVRDGDENNPVAKNSHGSLNSSFTDSLGTPIVMGEADNSTIVSRIKSAPSTLPVNWVPDKTENPENVKGKSSKQGQIYFLGLFSSPVVFEPGVPIKQNTTFTDLFVSDSNKNKTNPVTSSNRTTSQKLKFRRALDGNRTMKILPGIWVSSTANGSKLSFNLREMGNHTIDPIIMKFSDGHPSPRSSIRIPSFMNIRRNQTIIEDHSKAPNKAHYTDISSDYVMKGTSYKEKPVKISPGIFAPSFTYVPQPPNRSETGHHPFGNKEGNGSPKNKPMMMRVRDYVHSYKDKYQSIPVRGESDMNESEHFPKTAKPTFNFNTEVLNYSRMQPVVKSEINKNPDNDPKIVKIRLNWLSNETEGLKELLMKQYFNGGKKAEILPEAQVNRSDTIIRSRRNIYFERVSKPRLDLLSNEMEGPPKLMVKGPFDDDEKVSIFPGIITTTFINNSRIDPVVQIIQ